MQDRTMSDSDIIDLYWQRNEQAIAESQSKYGAACRSLSRGMLRNREDAEECVNDTWLRAWNAIPPARPDKLGAFLLRITRNLSLDRLRARMTDKHRGDAACVPLDELCDCLPAGVEGEPDTPAVTQAINDFLRAEPPQGRKLFVCRYFYHDSIADIARRFGLSESAVKSTLFRTRNRLRDYLEGEGIRI